MRFLKALALICGLVAPARATPYFNTPISSPTAGTAWASLSGTYYISASSASVSSITASVPTNSTWTIVLNGVNGSVTATNFSGPQITALAASTSAAAIQFAALAISTTATAVQLAAVAAATTTAYSAGATLTSTQTFSGANTFISTTVFQGPVQTSSLAYVSSFTFVPANSTAIGNSNLGVAIANSTVTFTSYVTSRHRVVINALVRGSDSATTVQCGILRNGKFFDGQGTGQGAWSMPSPTSPTYAYWSQTWISPTFLSSGTYSYTLTCATASGSVQFCSSGNSGLTSSCYVEAGEAKF